MIACTNFKFIFKYSNNYPHNQLSISSLFFSAYHLTRINFYHRPANMTHISLNSYAKLRYREWLHNHLDLFSNHKAKKNKTYTLTSNKNIYLCNHSRNTNNMWLNGQGSQKCVQYSVLIIILLKQHYTSFYMQNYTEMTKLYLHCSHSVLTNKGSEKCCKCKLTHTYILIRFTVIKKLVCVNKVQDCGSNHWNA